MRVAAGVTAWPIEKERATVGVLRKSASRQPKAREGGNPSVRAVEIVLAIAIKVVHAGEVMTVIVAVTAAVTAIRVAVVGVETTAIEDAIAPTTVIEGMIVAAGVTAAGARKALPNGGLSPPNRELPWTWKACLRSSPKLS